MGVLVLLLALRTGTLVVQTPHYGATVSVDRRPIGTAPVDPLRLSIGWHLVEVFARARPAWSRLIFIAPGQTVTVNVQLAALPVRRASQPADPAQPDPRWTLTGRAGLIGARRGDDASLALQHRARLGGTEVLGKHTRLSLAIFGESRVAGQGAELLRRIQPREASRLRIDEAMVAWRDLRGGRLLLTGPAHSLLVLDGLDGALRLGAHRVGARLGWQGAPVGMRPDDPVGGLRWRVQHDRGSGGLRWLYHQKHHVEADGQARIETVQLMARGSMVGRRLHRAQIDARRGPVRLGYGARGAGRSALIDPTMGLLRRDPRPWHGPRAGLDGAWRAWRSDLAAQWRRTTLGDRWLLRGGVDRRVIAWRLGVRLSGLSAHGQPIAQPIELQRQWRGAVTARWGRRIDLAGGAVWQATQAGRRWLPEANLRLDWPLVGALSLDVALSVQAVDPAVLPGRGVLTWGRLGVRLR